MMRRVLVCGLLLAGVAGCEQKKVEVVPVADNNDASITQPSDTSYTSSSYGGTSYPVTSSGSGSTTTGGYSVEYVPQNTDTTRTSAPPPTIVEAPRPTAAVADDGGAGRTHTVERGDTLYSLARKYYNDQSRWKSIWEANRSRLPDRNRLKPGMTLIIP